jgi:tetratricopeptide (TPR) repeat protein
VSFLLLTGLFILIPEIRARQQQSAAARDPDKDYKDQKDFALALFNKQHHLEALPIFEQLAQKHPEDATVMFGWGACLVDHSATVQDEETAKKERVRAREILLRAKQLGSNEPLLLNLLDMLAPDGSIAHASNLGVDKEIQAGEGAFARNDYDEATAHYSKAFELDPTNYSAPLFIGDCYFSKKDFSNAAIWYERAMKVNPDIETAYRYEADMFIKNGDMEKGRSRLIQAIVADPYNPVPWRALSGWAQINHVQIAPVHINTPGGVSQTSEGRINITLNPGQPSGVMSVWLAYSMVRAKWQGEEFKKHFPQESQYRRSLAEEAEALRTAASVASELKDKKDQQSIQANADLALLMRIYKANMIEPYVLLGAADRDIAQDYAAYREKNRTELEAYLDRFVVPQVPAKP